MASTPLGDIPGARFHFNGPTVAAQTSGGANSTVGWMGPFAHPIVPRGLYFQPTGGDQGGSAASYRRLTLINGGTAGTGTTVIGSLNITASIASLGIGPNMTFAADSVASIPTGTILVVSQLTVGAADATATVLRAGNLVLQYEIV